MSTTAVLPEGWAETTFGTVISNVSISEKKLPKGQYSESGRFPVVDQGRQFIGGYTDDEEKVVSDDLPVLVFGDHTRVFKFLNQPFVPGADGIKVLKPLGVNPKWLYQIAHALDFPDKGYARHFQHLKAAKLLIPPLPEQQRIVAEIEKQFTRLEAGVVALRRVQANLKRYRAAVLKAACEGKLVPTEAALAKTEKRKAKFETGEELLTRILTERRHNWQGRGKYKEPTALDAANLPSLPGGWVWASADQLTSLVTSGSRGWAEFYSDTGPLFIRAQDIKTDSLKLKGVARVTLPAKAEGMRSSVENGDLLITITGANVTKSAIVHGLSELAFVSQHVALLKPVCREAASFHFLWIVSPAHGRKFLEKWAYGAGKPGLSLEQVRNLPIALPPLAEQTRIVAEVERRLSVVEELEAAVSANLQRATRLRQSILQRAFTGELTK